MAAIELVDAIPLAKDAHGVYRVGGTRVTLDIVVRAFNRGATAEEIVQEFPSLQLSDVYQVIGYYLKHSAELAAYVENREREERTSGRPGDCASGCWLAGRIRELPALPHRGAEV